MTVEVLARGVVELGTRVLSTTGDLDEVVEACTTALRPHTLRTRGTGPLAARLDRVGLRDLSVNRLSYGASVTVSPAVPDEDNFLLVLPVAGRAEFRYGGDSADLALGHGAVVGPYREFEFSIDASFDQVIVRLDRSRVESVASAIAGDQGPVHFDLPGAPELHALVGLLASAVELADSAVARARPNLIGQLEQTVIEALLLSQHNTWSERLAAPHHASSARLRCALDYLDDHLDEPFSVVTLAAHCGVSVRSLQAAFRRELDTTPGTWLRARRLDRAHLLLTRAAPGGTTVTQVACAVGMFHLSEFAHHFRARFGLTPSELLRR